MGEPTCAVVFPDKTRCGGPVRYPERGWCATCYARSRRNGWADPGTIKRKTVYGSDATCLIDGCAQRPTAQNYCQDHYNQYKTHGDPEKRLKRRQREVRDELQAAAFTTSDECIPFKGDSKRSSVKLDGVTVNAARAVWIRRYGAPGELYVLHTCNGGSGAHGCININHLRVGTALENGDDKVASGRADSGYTGIRGEGHGGHLLTDEAVLYARANWVKGARYPHPGSTRSLAEKFGVKKGAIYSVVAHAGWKHLP